MKNFGVELVSYGTIDLDTLRVAGFYEPSGETVANAPDANANWTLTVSRSAFSADISQLYESQSGQYYRSSSNSGAAWTEWSLTQDSMAAFNTNAATSGATLTAANITGGAATVDLALTGALGAGANAQLPTVASMVAAMHNPATGASFRLRIINQSSGAFAWTVTTNTGWTLAGTMTIAQNTWREFVVTLTSATAATLQSVATGTYS